PAAAQHADGRAHRVVADAGLLRRLRGEAAGGADPLLAAGRALAGADRRLGGPGRHPAQDRRLRHAALRPAAVPACLGAVRADRDVAGRVRHPLRRRAGLCAERHQAAGGLHQHQPHGLRADRHLRRHRAGAAGRGDQHAGARHLGRRAVHPLRRNLRAPAHARPARDGRPVVALPVPAADRAVLRRRQPGPAGPGQLRRRIPDPDRHLPGGAAGHGVRHQRPDPRRRLRPDLRAACLLRPGARPRKQDARRPQPPRTRHHADPDGPAGVLRPLPAAGAGPVQGADARGAGDLPGSPGHAGAGPRRGCAVNFSLNWNQWQALAPILIVSFTIMWVMVAIAFRRHHWWNATVVAVGLNVALVSATYLVLPQLADQLPAYLQGPIAKMLAYFGHPPLPQTVTPLLIIDSYACFYMGLVLAAGLATATLTFAYMEGYKSNQEEVYILLALSALGGLVVVCSRHFAAFFIGLELLSLPLYGMIGYLVKERRSLEASMKYLVLSAVASAFILFGMALVFAMTGTLAFDEIGRAASGIRGPDHVVLMVAGCLLLVGIGFKLSLAPFHLWTPDVYE